MASVRELVEGVEAVMPRLLIVKDAERDVLPTSLIALDTSQAIDIVLPPRWAWEGHLVEADDCAVIATAVREDLLRRHQRNQRWKNIDRLVLRIRRARQGDAAWRSGRPEFQAGPAFMPSPSRPPVESLAKVRLGTRTIDLGVGNDRYEEPLGGNRSVLLVFQDHHCNVPSLQYRRGC